jgi:hypothetical protein
MRIRSTLAALFLCTGGVLVSCAIYEASEEATDNAYFSAKLKNLKGENLEKVCEAAKPKINQQGACQSGLTKTISIELPSGKKQTIIAKQFIPGECCVLESLCGTKPQLNASGECRQQSVNGTAAAGKKVPGACCTAACAGAKLDKNGICRDKNGKFTFGTCCQNECLVLADEPQGEVLCTEETCTQQPDENGNKPADDAGTCFCDAQCVDFGDCCSNAATLCELGRAPDGSQAECSKEECGGSGNPNAAPDAPQCFCDQQCVQFGDCCANVTEVCEFRGNRGPGTRGGSGQGTCEAEDCGGNSEGPEGAGCFCDAACVEFGDCCANAAEACPDVIGTNPRGEGARSDIKGECAKTDCGGPADADDPNTCFCDSACTMFGDCCENFANQCPDLAGREGRGRGIVAPTGACTDKTCGGASADGSCFCDDVCAELGDCCSNKAEVCEGNTIVPDRVNVIPGLCEATDCGKNSKSDGSGCFCDDACAEFGDCCANKASKCGGPGITAEVIQCGADTCAGAKLDDKGACRGKNGEFAKASCCLEASPISGGAIKTREKRANASRAARGLPALPTR